MTVNPDGIPDELKSYVQWVAHDADKVPYNAKSGFLASTADRQTWGSFEEAVASYRAGNGRYTGIGFVFTKKDPFIGIDFDDPWKKNPDGSFVHSDPQAVFEYQKNILARLPTYTEFSPSGKGVHAIGKDSVPRSLNRSFIEMYSEGRYFTFTGNRFNDLPIANINDKANEVWTEIEESPQSSPAVDATQYDQPQTADDSQVWEQARKAKNGDLFFRLWNGDWSGYPSQSQADQAIVNMIANKTKNRDQIARMFRSSGLGQRSKAKRYNYVYPMVDKAMIPLWDKIDGVDLSLLLAEAYSRLPKLRIIDANALLATPAPSREWHVPDMIPARNVTMLGGDGGTGKTLLALQLALATTTAMTWLGMEVRQGGCLFFTAEDEQDEIHRRLADIVRAEGIPHGAIVGLDIPPSACRRALGLRAGRCRPVGTASPSSYPSKKLSS